ncbi:MAG TPA: DCC1-like thiol-disulfide oxidoreductase family protein [Burkholderiales bacterium]|jgi:predicted DCC family thiol-disulfide oxidoreductase YuxK|nr:DCC1-like thiol-disulfide oxidoreductase family protein [Burkholderiales bacterium]
MPPREILLVYDRECPVCEAYCRRVRIRGTIGMLRLVNAREPTAVMEEITARGLDIDEGMVLKVDNVLHYGADAIHALALMSSRSDAFGRLSYRLFGSRVRARILYPVFRVLRNGLLKILRKNRINNLKRPGNDRF